MNGAHDLGGTDGFGPVQPEPGEPVFHTAWERRVFGLTLAAGMLGRWNIDQSRYAREDTDPLTYLRASYYQTWLRGLERLLVERGLVGAAELQSGRPYGPGPVAAVGPERAAEVLARGALARRPDTAPPRFAPGDRVRVRNEHPRGHTRMPRYCRGRTGVVARDNGTQVYPDSNAMHGEEDPRRCYSVRFEGGELWGSHGGARDCVYVDLWEPYLEPA